MNPTKIEYLDFTWNPLAMRCTPISEGCAHCWHIRMAKRHAGNPIHSPDVRAAYEGHNIALRVKELEAPLLRRKPARIGVQFMGDLFLEGVGYHWQEKVWNVMEATPQHTYVILTKRPDNMYATLDSLVGTHGILRNVWLGTSIEHYKYGFRADYLRRCPAAGHFLSLEPLLSSMHDYPGIYDGMNWVVIGAETGPGARPMNPDWARSVRDQCKAAGVPFFFKQMSNKAPIPDDLMIREWPGRERTE